MNVPEIKGREHLEAWLKTRSREECIAIAHRAAMRVAQLWIAGGHSTGWTRKIGLTDSLFFRLLLTSGVSAVSSTPQVVAASNAVIARLGSVELTDYNDAVPAAAIEIVNRPDFASAAADAVVAAVHAAGSEYAAENAIWYSVWSDLNVVKNGKDPFTYPLWQGIGYPFSGPQDNTQIYLNARGPDWDFWVRWYDAALRGQSLNWKMQEEIAVKIPPKVWEGDVAGLAAAIAMIEKKYSKVRKPRQAKPKPDVIGELLDGEKKGSKSAIAKVKAAIDQHHRELPATFDAVLGFIWLEFQRLQQKNYQSDNERDEAVRQIEVLTILDAAVRAMQAAIPAQVPIDLKEAEKVEKLSRLFARKYGEWPRTNADDLVDSTCRFALVGAVTCLAPLIGVAAPYVFIGASALFGGKKIADAVKLAIDVKTLNAPRS